MATNVRSHPFIKVLIGFYLLFLASAAQSALMFTGNMIDVSYVGSDFTVGTNSFIAGDTTPDPDIAYQDGSNIGNGLMIDFESITFNDDSIVFELRGDGPEHSNSAFQKTGLLGSYHISLASPGIVFDSISVGTTANIIGLCLDSGITFDTNTIYFDLSAFGVLDESDADIGSVTINASFAAVPVPAALPLMLSGLAGLLLVSRRRKSA